MASCRVHAMLDYHRLRRAFMSQRRTHKSLLLAVLSAAVTIIVLNVQHLQRTPSAAERLQEWKTGVLKAIGSPEEVDRLRGNFFIADVRYQLGAPPPVRPESSPTHFAPFYIAADLARRYKLKYIVELGFSNFDSLQQLFPFFIPVGISLSPSHLRSNNSKIKVIPVTFSANGSCHVTVSDSVLSNSVVLSTGVIELLQDPSSCFLKLLRDLSGNSHAVVLSISDRGVASPHKTNLHGPPSLQTRVREWTLKELELLAIDSGLFPFISGRVCANFLLCPGSFLPLKHNLTNSIIITRKKHIGEWRVIGRVPKMSGTFLAFVLMRSTTNVELLVENVEHLLSHGVDKVHVLVNDDFPDEFSLASSLRQFPSSQITHLYRKDIRLVLREVLDANVGADDWVILTDANEFVQPIRDASVRKPRLRDALSLAETEGFNSAAVTSVFTDKQNERTLVKIYGLSAWNKDNDMDFKRHSPVYRHRIRVWKGRPRLAFQSVLSKEGFPVVTGVTFPEMLVYPYAFVGERIPPHVKKRPQSPLEDNETQRLLAFPLSLQFSLSDSLPALRHADYDY